MGGMAGASRRVIRIEKTAEPADFHVRVREPGRRWMERGTEGTPGYWRRASRALREAFQHRCAYSAVWLSAPGTMDHFVSRDEDPSLSYEWSNFRYAAGWFNSSKGSLRVSQKPGAIARGPFLRAAVRAHTSK